MATEYTTKNKLLDYKHVTTNVTTNTYVNCSWCTYHNHYCSDYKIFELLFNRPSSTVLTAYLKYSINKQIKGSQ